MRIAGLYHDVQKNKDITRTVYHSTRLLNAGMLKQLDCGSNPLPPGTVTVTQIDSTGATWHSRDVNPLAIVRVVFLPSAEEAGGLKDISSYVVERTISGTSNWDVLSNVAAVGSASYTFNDYQFLSGSWVYGAVAVNCSPAYSAVTPGSVITNP